jgi:hypothetical protein
MKHLENIQKNLKEGQRVAYEEGSEKYIVYFSGDKIMFTDQVFDDLTTQHDISAGEIVQDAINMIRENKVSIGSTKATKNELKKEY